MDFKLEDFFPLYPESPEWNINNLKEFTDNRLDTTEELPTEPGIPTKHQIVIKRLLSGYTRFDGLLLVHEMGTGKTCSAVQAIEQNLTEEGLFGEIGPGLNGAVILTRGKTLMNNFIDELVNRCTNKKYTDLSSKTGEVSRMSKKLYSKFYSFFTFEIFARTVKKMSPSEIISKFNNKVIVIDEAHNIRLNALQKDLTVDDEDEGIFKKREKLDIYTEIHRFVHLLDNKKVLLLTGTPMKDGPQEIASLMNLILPLDQQMSTQKNFLREYFPPVVRSPSFPQNVLDEDGFLQDIREMKNKESFKNQIHGSVSFLKAMDSTTQKVLVGQKMGSLKYYKVVPEYMSEFQSSVYNNAYRQDKKESGIYLNSRQASRLVFSDGTFGSEGFKNNIIESKNSFRLGASFKRELLKGSGTGRINDEFVILNNIKKFSAKYANIIGLVLEASRHGELSIVYDDAVRGSGLIVLTLLLELFGFTRNSGVTRVSKSFGLLTTETATAKEIRNILKIFNNNNNMNGQIMSVIFGSRVISEGLTFKNVIHEHVVPHWNDSETSQVIARGWRLGSHEALLTKWYNSGQEGKKPQLNVYRHAVFARNGDSIDMIMYEISEKKDIAISKVLRCLKEASLDCQIFKKRNEKDASFDNQRECEYEKCDYICDSGPPAETRNVDVVNYQTIYFREDVSLMMKMLEDHFKTRYFSSLDDIVKMFNNPRERRITLNEIVQLLHQLVSNNVTVKNVYGYPCYLYENNNIFFLIDHTIPFPVEEDIFIAYYSKHPQHYVNIESRLAIHSQKVAWFNTIMNEYHQSLIPKSIKELNELWLSPSVESKELISKKLISLPNTIQQRLLEMTVSAKIIDMFWQRDGKFPLPKHLAKEWNDRSGPDPVRRKGGGEGGGTFQSKRKFRSIILNHYKNYFKIDDIDTFQMAIVWFVADIVEERAKEKCLYINSLTDLKRPLWNEWKVCGKKERARVEVERDLLKKRYETSLGYYGLWNPKLNEFCIRDTGIVRSGDKRNVASGKRCTNWTKSALTELAAISINLPIPQGAVLPTVESAIKTVRENRLLMNILPSNPTDDTFVKIAFWYGLSRNDMCSNLKNWFEKNNLLVQDNSCGVQTKRK